MNIRPVAEEDIEAIINLFRLNYGEDYAIPEFYDPMWVKRGIYSDHIIWLVVEDEGRVAASGTWLWARPRAAKAWGAPCWLRW